jgi:hypothetical protein
MPNQLICISWKIFKMSQVFPELYECLGKQDRLGNLLANLQTKKDNLLDRYLVCGLSIFPPGTEFQPRVGKAPLLWHCSRHLRQVCGALEHIYPHSPLSPTLKLAVKYSESQPNHGRKGRQHKENIISSHISGSLSGSTVIPLRYKNGRNPLLTPCTYTALSKNLRDEF